MATVFDEYSTCTLLTIPGEELKVEYHTKLCDHVKADTRFRLMDQILPDEILSMVYPAQILIHFTVGDLTPAPAGFTMSEIAQMLHREKEWLVRYEDFVTLGPLSQKRYASIESALTNLKQLFVILIVSGLLVPVDPVDLSVLSTTTPEDVDA